MTLTFVFPKKFTGLATITERSDAGVDPERATDGYIYRFPSNGVLVVKNLKPFEKWHKIRAEYAGGRAIEVANPDSGYPEQIALHSLSRKGRDTIHYYVGYERDKDEFLRQHYQLQ